MTTKTALITGASSGIGLELAKLFAKNGFYLILVARSEERLEKLADELRYENHVQVATFAKDLTDLNEVQSLYQMIEEENIFIEPKPYMSWIRNGSIWEAPTPMPVDDKFYTWNESELQWEEI